MEIKSKGDKILNLNAVADQFFIQNPGLDACLQKFIDPDPDIIFQSDIY
jgi:hypothetical protein